MITLTAIANFFLALPQAIISIVKLGTIIDERLSQVVERLDKMQEDKIKAHFETLKTEVNANLKQISIAKTDEERRKLILELSKKWGK